MILLLLIPTSGASGLARLAIPPPGAGGSSAANSIDMAEATLAMRLNETTRDRANFELARGLLAAATAPTGTPATRALGAANAALTARLSEANDSWRPALLLEQDNVRTAADIAALLESGGRDRLAAAVAIVDRDAPNAAAAWGASPPAPAPAPETPSPSAAATLLLASHGITPSEEQAHAIAGLDALPSADRAALGSFLASYAAFEAASNDAFSALSPADVLALRNASEAEISTGSSFTGAPDIAPLARLHVHIDPVLSARSALLHATLNLRNALRATPVNAEPVLVPPVLAINLTTGDSTYTDDYRLLLDAGGNDTYLNNAGGTGGSATSAFPYCVPSAPGAASVLVDLGGNDRYVGHRACGANGGGALGTGVLVDDGGDDRYDALGFGANGGGYLGLGLLLDTGGNDAYTAPAGYGTNGGGDLGQGALVDVSGNDTYTGGQGANGAGAFGSGFLVDGAGDDTYVSAMDRGANGAGSVGTGFLLDLSGNDTYSGTNSGVNGGGTAGAGALFDLGGSDRYVGGDQAVNGGASAGVGLLVDAQGDDTYSGSVGGINGGAVEGVGILLDLEGNDHYVAGYRGVNGGAALNGAGLLFDGAGDDIYDALSAGANGGGFQPGSAGFLLDAAGNDTYRTPGGSGAQSSSAAQPFGATNGWDGLTAPGSFALGFTAIPPGLTVGGTWAGARVLAVEPALGLVTLQVTDPLRILSATAGNPSVRYLHPIVTERLMQAMPNDPRFGDQYGPQIVGAIDAWNVTRGDPSLRLCVVDTGVNYRHEDLEGSRYLGGVDLVNNDTDPWDDAGHGSHVTGIAAATMDNGKGMAGLAQVSYYAVKVLDSMGRGSNTDVARAIVWCVDHGARIVSMSLGSTTRTPEQADAVRYAWAHGALLVAASGNAGPCYGCVLYPAAFPEVIAVGCTTATDSVCSFTSGGPEMEIAAPGDAILSASSEAPDAYMLLSGTSMSTPHVAGVAALVWSAVPGLSNCELREILRDTAKDVGDPGWDPSSGFGRIDAKSAVAAAQTGVRPAACPLSGWGASRYGVNGGAYDHSTGFLLDLAGADRYAGGVRGVNGGSDLVGQGRLLDVAGDDSYEAIVGGVNGGVTAADGSTGVLADLAGHDTYRDDEGGSGRDVTVAAKGAPGGLQLDVPAAPGA